jgi:hypothetical protein
VTQQDSPSDAAPDQVPAEPQPLEYRSPLPQASAPPDPPTWFGYIGLGIAIFSLLIGVAGMVFAVIWFIGWTRS